MYELESNSFKDCTDITEIGPAPVHEFFFFAKSDWVTMYAGAMKWINELSR